jgi:hypothetical protein
VPTDTLTPVPGDPDVVYAAGRTLASIAVEIADTAARLRALAGANTTSTDLGWTGQAAVKAYARAITLPPKLDKAHTSYADAGAALIGYANALYHAQAEAAAAIGTASGAEADLAHLTAAKAAATVADAQQAAAAAATGVPAPAPTAQRYDADVATAQTRVTTAWAANIAAHDQQTDAATRAAAALRHASHDGITNKKWWQHAIAAVGHWASTAWSDSLRFISRYAATISAITGLAALVLSIAGLVFPPLEIAAAALEAISAGFGAIAAISDLALAATSKGSWTTVGWDALAILPAGAAKAIHELAPALRESRAIRSLAKQPDRIPPKRWPPRRATSKVPSSWGHGRPGRKGTSWRWDDPSDRGSRVRVDKGDPTSSQPSQRVHHVVIGHKGVIVGRDGNALPGRLKDFPELGHVPLHEWLTWSEWSKP